MYITVYLHWLRIESRVRYKVLVTIHNAIHSTDSPHHLKEAITIAHQHSPREQPPRLIQHAHRKRTGGHALHHYAPDMWNSLHENSDRLPKQIFDSRGMQIVTSTGTVRPVTRRVNDMTAATIKNGTLPRRYRS